MGEKKAFFGVSKSEVNRFRDEVKKDYGMNKFGSKPKSTRKRKRR